MRSLSRFSELGRSLRLHRVLFMVALGVSLILVASPARAQFVQYAPPGDFQSPAEAREEVLTRAMERARWRFGRLLVDPWIFVRNVTYQEDQASGGDPPTTSDLTLSIGAGVNTYMTLGSDFIWGTFVLPEYTWWQDLDERRRLNGRYGTGLFGNLGRLGVEATISRFDESSIFSDEVQQQASQRSDRGDLSVTLDLGKGFLLFGDVELRSLSSLEDDTSLEFLNRLDRDETVYRAGVGFRSPRGVKLGIGFERSDVEFDESALNRSNSGDAIVFDFTYEARLFILRGQVASRSVEPEGGADFVPFDDITGDVNLGWRPIGPARIELYARQDVAYSVQPQISYIEYDLAGVGVRFSL